MVKALTKKTRLGWGKLRRMYLVYLRPGYVSRRLALRQGECKRCGACCRLMFNCWNLINDPEACSRETNGHSCKLYLDRSQVCQYFPLDERDLKERDLLMPHVKCGFTFNSHSESI